MTFYLNGYKQVELPKQTNKKDKLHFGNNLINLSCVRFRCFSLLDSELAIFVFRIVLMGHNKTFKQFNFYMELLWTCFQFYQHNFCSANEIIKLL